MGNHHPKKKNTHKEYETIAPPKQIDDQPKSIFRFPPNEQQLAIKSNNFGVSLSELLEIARKNDEKYTSFPADILITIFASLDTLQFLRAIETCRRWYLVGITPSIWLGHVYSSPMVSLSNEKVANLIKYRDPRNQWSGVWNLENCYKLTDRTLKLLEPVLITSLNLTDCPHFSIEAMESLIQKCSHTLETFVLRSQSLSPSAYINCIRLKKLHTTFIFGPQTSLLPLSVLTTLTDLNLGSSQFTVELLEALAPNLQKFTQSAYFSTSTPIPRMPKLQSLTLVHAYDIAFPYCLPTVTELRMDKISPNTVFHLFACVSRQFPNLEYLSMAQPQLGYLDFSLTSSSAEWCQFLSKMKHLKVAYLGDWPIEGRLFDSEMVQEFTVTFAKQFPERSPPLQILYSEPESKLVERRFWNGAL